MYTNVLLSMTTLRTCYNEPEKTTLNTGNNCLSKDEDVITLENASKRTQPSHPRLSIKYRKKTVEPTEVGGGGGGTTEMS